MRGFFNIVVGLIFTVGLLVLVLEYLAHPLTLTPAPQASAPQAVHGCAIFGGSLPPPCQSYPRWRSGAWPPPAGVSLLHVLAVGGGGGGGAAIMNGSGGSGGGSGGVVVQDVTIGGSTAIEVKIGQPGQGGQKYLQAGDNGQPSQFGSLAAYGGGGAANNVPTRPPGSGQEGASGGGGAGGGSAQHGFAGGSGGNGGTSGGSGQDGYSGGAPARPVAGQPGGAGFVFPALPFTMTAVAPGQGGAGGAAIGQDGTGCGGGGGGGGGGVLLGGAGPSAAPGPSPPSGVNACGNGIGLSGQGGAGYGAGGGGGGNFAKGTPGGAGAPGVVYVEW